MFHYHCRQIFTLLTTSLLATCLITSSANAEIIDRQSLRSIHVSGTGKMSIKPDKADLTLSVEVHAKTAEAARTQAASTMESVIKAVKGANVADKDIQTSSVSLYPNYSSDTANKIVGYTLTNQVAIHIRSVDKASELIDFAVKAGGNAVRVQGINFGVENPEAALVVAREQAYANAKTKAEQYAKMAGLTLGAPIQIIEGNNIPAISAQYSEMRTMKAAMADSPSTPVQTGEQDVTVTVDVVFGI